MMGYKIVSKGSKCVTYILKLSRSLKPNSEIISFSNTGETLVGLISHRSLAYLSCEFASYAYKNYTNHVDLKAKECINLTRKCIENPSSVSKSKLYKASNFIISEDHKIIGKKDILYSIYYAAGVALTSEVTMATTYAADAAIWAAESASSIGTEEDKEREFIRQGEFILDYLKSGLYLFHLEK